MFDSDKASDRQAMALAYDRVLQPEDETECWWRVEVTITREYEGAFYGTKEGAKESAKRSFKKHDQDFDEEFISAESNKEATIL